MTFYHEIETAADDLIALKKAYLRRFGWDETCNAPGSYWVWRRDFKAEDDARHKRWKEDGPGPYGWPSEPHPYGVITADLDMAVMMTVRELDEQPEMEQEDEP